MSAKKALAAISFGTSYVGAQHAITNIEQALCTAFPDAQFHRAFTSRIIIEKLRRTEGVTIPTPSELMTVLSQQDFREVYCQTLHVIPGLEYNKMREELAAFAGQYDRFVIGTPLLYHNEDYAICAKAVLAHTPPLEPDEALVLMGHGTEHFANAAYSQLESTFRSLNADHVFVGTVEGFPEIDDVITQLKKQGIRKALLMPFMIVAGDHALNDLASDEPDSWKSKLEQQGFAVCTQLTGLGEFPEIAALICDHLRNALRIALTE